MNGWIKLNDVFIKKDEVQMIGKVYEDVELLEWFYTFIIYLKGGHKIMNNHYTEDFESSEEAERQCENNRDLLLSLLDIKT